MGGSQDKFLAIPRVACGGVALAVGVEEFSFIVTPEVEVKLFP